MITAVSNRYLEQMLRNETDKMSWWNLKLGKTSSDLHHPIYKDHVLEYSFKSNPGYSARVYEPFRVFCRKTDLEKIKQSMGESQDEWDLFDIEDYEKDAKAGNTFFDSIIAEFRINCVNPGNPEFEEALSWISGEYEKNKDSRKIIPLDCRGGKTYILQHIFDQTQLEMGVGSLSFYRIVEDGISLKNTLKRKRAQSAY